MRSEEEIRKRMATLIDMAIRVLREIQNYIAEILVKERSLPSLTVCAQSLYLVVRYLEVINTLRWVLGED